MGRPAGEYHGPLSLAMCIVKQADGISVIVYQTGGSVTWKTHRRLLQKPKSKSVQLTRHWFQVQSLWHWEQEWTADSWPRRTVIRNGRRRAGPAGPIYI